MRRIALPVAACLTLMQPSFAFADGTYSAQVALTYSRSDTETSTFTEGPGASATYYLRSLALDPGDYPLHEGPFVERAGSVSVDYARVSRDIRDNRELESGSDIGAALVYRQSDSPLYARVGYRRIDFGKLATTSSSPTPFEYQQETKLAELALGAYVGRTSLLTIEADRQSSTTTFSTRAPSEFELREVGFAARHLARFLEAEHIALDGRIMRSKLEREGAPSETNRRAEILVTYYPRRTVALSAYVAKLSGDTEGFRGTAYGLGLDVYLTSRANAYLKLQKLRRDPPNDDTDAVMLGFAFRF